MEFKYTADPDAEEPKMYLDEEIGVGENGIGVNGAQFAKELRELDRLGKRRVEIWINSLGGNVMDGLNIFNAILYTKCKVDTYCGGIAASIAGIIFVCGRIRCMSPNAKIMMHDPHGGDEKSLTEIKDILAITISERSGLTVDQVNRIMSEETWIGYEDALKLNVCNDKIPLSEANKGRLAAMENKAVVWLNKLDKTSTNNMADLKKVTNALKLNPEASADAIYDEVEKLQKGIASVRDSLSAKETELSTITNRATKAEKDLEAKQAEYDAMKTKCDTTMAELQAMKDAKKIEDEKKEAEDKVKMAAEETELEDKVNKVCAKLILDGALENTEATVNKEKAFWKAAYKVDKEATNKKIIDVLNSAKGKAPRIENGAKPPEGSGGDSIAQEMIRLNKDFEKEHVKN